MCLMFGHDTTQCNNVFLYQLILQVQQVVIVSGIKLVTYIACIVDLIEILGSRTELVGCIGTCMSILVPKIKGVCWCMLVTLY